MLSAQHAGSQRPQIRVQCRAQRSLGPRRPGGPARLALSHLCKVKSVFFKLAEEFGSGIAVLRDVQRRAQRSLWPRPGRAGDRLAQLSSLRVPCANV
jgi:hypothetical protein